MDESYIQFTLSNAPAVGMISGLLIFTYGLISRRPRMMQTAYGFFVVTAVITVLVTGRPAAGMGETWSELSEILIMAEKEFARTAIISAIIFGVFSIAGFIIAPRKLPPWFKAATLILGLVVLAVVACTGQLGC